ncbi:AtaL-like protein [Kitasatospora sp. NPDC056138]|uniref:AtaL-like protein n=1 Tax=Kitasatospora sp. NPDC056138 TaxID=3345724 RepID=UPI0035DC66F2
MVISWDVPVNTGSTRDAARITAVQLWEQLLRKAENPVPYVPAITECTILDRFPGGFTREIVRDGSWVFQRVEIEPGRSIVYHQPGDPDVESIVNQVGRDDNGGPTLTISVHLAPEGIEKVIRESRFLEATDAYFTDALRAVVDEIRATAGELTPLPAAA